MTLRGKKKKDSKNNKTLMIYRWAEAETYIRMSILTTSMKTYGVPWITCLENRGISPYCCRWCISRKILWRKYRAHFFSIFHIVKFLLTKECFWQTQLADYWIWSHVTEGRIWTKCIENVCAANNFVIFS